MFIIKARPIRQHRPHSLGLLLVCVALAFAGMGIPGIVLVSSVQAANINYYVDCSAGSNGNGSQSSPWNTLSSVNSFTLEPGDKVLFKRGMTCTGTFAPKGSGSSAAPIIADTYGTGNQPIIAGNGADQAIYLYNQQYWELRNLEITNNATTAANRKGIYIVLENYGTGNYFRLTNLYVHNVKGDNAKDANPSGGIILEVKGKTTLSKFNDVIIDSCTIQTVDRTGIRTWSSYGGEPTGLPWGSQFTDRPRATQNWPSGWTNVVIRNNALNDIGGDGIVSIHTDGALIENNVVNGANVRANTYGVGIWAWDANNTTFQYNEAYNVQTTLDGQAFDIDYNQDNTLFQYNYSHDNEGGFFLFMAQSDRDATVRYNLSVNDRRDDVWQFNQLTSSSDFGNLQIYNNTIYIGTVATNASMGNVPAGVGVYNNLFFNAKGGDSFSCGSTCSNNMFSGISATSSSAGVSANPLFINPGSTPTGRDNVSGYQVHSASPAVGAGRTIANNGGKDFWGNPVSSSGAPTIGAYQTTGGGGTGAFTVDDRTTGTGLNQFNYVGSWEGCSGCVPEAYNSSSSWSSTTDSYVTITFNGTQLKLYGERDPAHGIGAVSIDGGSETTVDFYAASGTSNVLLWTSPILAAGEHTLKLRVTGTRNTSASGTWVVPDRVDVSTGSGGTNTIIVDDRITGTGLNQFNYTGSWEGCSSCVPEAYNSSSSWSQTTDSYVTITFNGTQLKLYGERDPNHGIGSVSIDGGSETTVDFYAASGSSNVLLWASPILAAGQHTFKLRVTGTRNVSASDTWVVLDRVDISGS